MLQAPSFLEIKSDLSESMESFTARLDTALTAIGSVIAEPGTLRGLTSERSNPGISFSMPYTSGGALSHQLTAQLYTLPDGADRLTYIDNQINAYMVANDAQVLNIFDVTPQRTRYIERDQVLVIFIDNAGAVWAQSTDDPNRLILVRATTDVAPDASDTFDVLTATGTSGTVTVTNKGDVDWLTDEEGYATYEPSLGVIVGVPGYNYHP